MNFRRDALVLTGVTGRVISRYGIAAGLGVRRQSLTIFTIVMIGLSFWSAEGALALFLFASATKMVDLILGRSLTGPAFLILYQPLHAEKRIPTQLAVASTFGPIAGGFAGVVLLVMNQLDLSDILYFNLALLVVLVCWRFVSAQVNAGYKETLPKALERRRLEGTALALDEVGLVEALGERLGSERPQEAIYALELLVKSQPEHQERFLVDLLEHPHPQVRHEVLQRIFRGGLTQLQTAVEHRVETEKESFVRAAAVLALCELSESDAVDSVGPLLDAEEPEVRRAAMAGLLRRGGIDGILLAGERLVGLERSELPHERELAASVLGEVGERSFYRQLLPLLADPEPQVRRAALAAAGAVRHRRLWPAVLDHLSTRAYESSAISAFVNAGDAALPALAQALDDDATSAQQRTRIAAICGRIGGEAAGRILASHIDCDDRITRLEVLTALERCRFRPASGSPVAETTRSVLQGELDDATWLLGAIVDLGHGDDFELLRSALDYRLTKIRRRCLLLISFLYDSDTMKRVGHQLENTVVEQRAIALEVLDTTLPRKLKRTVLPLFEGSSSLDCLRKLEASFPQQSSDRRERLRSFLTDSERDLGTWIQACALYTAGTVDEDTFLTQMREMRSSDKDIVRETAWWAVAQLDREQGAEQLADGAATSAPEGDLLHTSGRKSAMLLTVEKVIVLRSVSVFSSVPEEVLADLAGFLDEIEVEEGDPVYEKGAIGRTMYIVADGKVRIHDGDHMFVELGPGEFFGELTTLDPEPHSASATAIVDSQLLGLDRDALYDVMGLHSEVLRGLIHALCQRLRRKN